MAAKRTKKTDRVLILKTVGADMRAHGGFEWPTSGPVECPTWDPTPDCGGGLHGLLWGCGSGLIDPDDPTRKWVVFAADPADVVEVGAKVKARRGDVVFVGIRDEAIAYLDANGAADKPVAYATHTSGAEGTSTSGYRGTSTSGAEGTSTSGAEGTSTSGDWGTSTSGDRGTSTSGDWGTSTSGKRGIIVCRWWDGTAGRWRLTVGYVGEDGIEPDVPYRADSAGRLVKAEVA